MPSIAKLEASQPRIWDFLNLESPVVFQIRLPFSCKFALLVDTFVEEKQHRVGTIYILANKTTALSDNKDFRVQTHNFGCCR